MADQVPPIFFNGMNFDFHSVKKIAEGSGVYYTPSGQDPNRANDEIIINYLNAKDERGNPITAQGMASAMVANIKAHNANFVYPFAAPDPAHKEQMIYYVLSYSIFPQDGNGEIWRARVMQRGERVIGLLIKHQVDGTGAGDIEAKIKAWMNESLQAEVPMVDAIPIPPEPPRG